MTFLSGLFPSYSTASNTETKPVSMRGICSKAPRSPPITPPPKKTKRENWHVKEGLYSPDDDAVKERAERVRSRAAELVDDLKDMEKGHVVIVTHGVFMKFLVEDLEIDLPKAGWKSYR